MPLVRVSLRRGKPPAFRKAILDGIYSAMLTSFDVPEEDRFMTITEHDEADFSYSKSYLGIARSDDLVMIQITANTRARSKGRGRFIGRSSRIFRPIPACGLKTSSSTSSKSFLRTGRSAMASRNTRPPRADDDRLIQGETS
jgi:hypothetical protein